MRASALFFSHIYRMMRRMSLRHLAREVVAQALFTWDFYEKDSSATNEAFSFALDQHDVIHDVDFPKELFNGVIRKVDVIDEIIEKAAPAWPIDRIAPVDRNILRLGIYEMLFSERNDVPPKVAINEAIELGKSFGGPNSYKFISGVLGSIYEASDLKAQDDANGKKKIDFDKLPISVKTGAVVYSVDDEGVLRFAFVHDIFGRWTLSKGGIEEGENPEECIAREIKEELHIDVEVKESLGMNEYLANDKEHGKIRKQVHYFLTQAPYSELKLSEDETGLVDAQWFTVEEIKKLSLYDDITKLIKEGVEAAEKQLAN